MSVAGRTVTGVNRTDRLYALIEELRAISPRYVEVAELAARFGVSRRTIARDLSMLRDSGLPIASAPRMGYRLDITPAPHSRRLREAILAQDPCLDLPRS